MRLLVAEDDERILSNLQQMLVRENFVVDAARTREEAINKSLTDDYDLIILDWMFPDGFGDEVIKSIRDEKIHTPILLLTAKSQSEDIISGLDAGADDYVTKPYDASVLLARIRALLRREPIVNEPILSLGNLSFDPQTHELTVDTDIVELTKKEKSIIEYLLAHKNMVVSRENLLMHCWGEEQNSFSNIVDVNIKNLRSKLPHNCSVSILTIKGMGYRLCDRLN